MKKYLIYTKHNCNKGLIGVLLLIHFSEILTAQNTSYNLNSTSINGTFSTAFGWQTLLQNTGNFNAAMGYMSLFANNTGSYNTANGGASLYSNTSGKYNTAIGTSSMYYNINGQQNTAVGTYALFYNSTGERNTALGFNALKKNTLGMNNIGIGYGADVAINNLTNAIAIGAGAVANFSNSIQLGNSLTTNVYLGTNQNVTLYSGYVKTGKITITEGSPGLGKVLTSDINGNGLWQTLPEIITNNSWASTGNSNTSDQVNFIGTIDNVPFNIRVNNSKSGRIDHINNNSFYGYLSGSANTLGSFNTAFGSNGLQANLSGSYNASQGYNALKENLNGSYNSAFGAQSLKLNTSGSYNVAAGSFASYSNVTGSYNVAIGMNAMFNSTSGKNNVSIGHENLWSNVNGNENTSVGSYALGSNTAGNKNTAMGTDALALNTIGINNVGIGKSALELNVTGSTNTAIGTSSNTGSPDLQNATAIGANAIVNESNKVRIGSPTITVVEGPVVYTVSDGRFKKDIKESDVKGIEFIKRLRPVAYNFDTRKYQEFLIKNIPDSMKQDYLNQNFTPSTSIRQSGFIAQEVEKAARETGYNFNGVHTPDSQNDNYSISYAQFVVPLVKAIQEQQIQIEDQKKLNLELKERLLKLEEQISRTISLYTDDQVNSSAMSNAITLVPNPSSGSVEIRIENHRNELFDLEILNSAGMLVMKKSSWRPGSIDLSNFSKGIYIVRLKNSNQFFSKKLIVE